MNPRTARLAVGLVLLLSVFTFAGTGDAKKPLADPAAEYAATIRPLVVKYCVGCHSAKAKKGGLDLDRFATAAHLHQDPKPWQTVVELLEAGEMPPKEKPQPSDAERKQLIAWAKSFLDSEARARAGDPGLVPLRRLSNAEYNYTVRDLTGVDLRPAREFPADGAAGEGFTNASEALADISPALFTKYLNAAKDIADHAVFLPDGLRFSPDKTRRDWTDESMTHLRAFFARYTPDGKLPLQPYLAATVRHRADLLAGTVTPEAVAAKEKLHPKYLRILWTTLTDKTSSYPLDLIRARWRQAAEKDVGALAAEIAAWQAPVWRFVPIGSYRDDNTVRQLPNDPQADEGRTVRFAFKPAPGQSEVVLHLAAHQILPPGGGGHVVWHRPRFEGGGKPPVLLRDYPQYGPRYEVDYPALFADTRKYLAAAAEAAADPKVTAAEIARKNELDETFLKRWIDLLGLEIAGKGPEKPRAAVRVIPAGTLELLAEKAPRTDTRPAINGWRKKGTDLPILIANASDKTEQVPGTIGPHKVAVHPTPQEFVAVGWTSPVAGTVRITARIAHAHPTCGNGVAWRLEHRQGAKAGVLAEGATDLGKVSAVPPRDLKVAAGDIVLLAIDARDANHSCDLTEIDLVIADPGKNGRTWTLAGDVADTVLDGNPHADTFGNKAVWSFVRGAAFTSPAAPANGPTIPADSVLGRWHDAAVDPARRDEAARLAGQVQTLLAGPRPAAEKHPDRILYDNLVFLESPLLRDLDTAQGKARPRAATFGLAAERFGRHPQGKPTEEASLVAAADSMTEVRLPAALFRDREFVVEGQFDAPATDRVVQFQVGTTAPAPSAPWDGKTPVAAVPGGVGHKELLRGLAAFRSCFPQVICYPRIIPEDEVVCLKLYHREDEALTRLFLDDEAARRLDRLWLEHRFISRWPVTENDNLPQFIGFVTQDQPKALVQFFEGKREPFRTRAEAFEREVEAAGPKQLDAVLAFAARAYRHPLRDREKSELTGLYATLRKKGIGQEDALRGVLSRVLVSPSFLFRLEQAPAGKESKPVDDWELATRLSYFLWSTLPDEDLKTAAAAGRLSDPRVLATHAERMLKDDRVRALAIEFGTQWVHVRGFDELKEKNEKLFPTFDESLRAAIYEESILFFEDLFRADRPVPRVLDADYTFLNEALAKHYGIPGVTGPQWRKVDGIRKYGRGGVLGLASVQAKESGASRTSPVLRGNWVVETLLGEKLPRPPANVPRLPEDERGNDGLTMRVLVEKHTRVPECATCHVRIDPFGFALEKYDPIGRLRDKDLGGLPVDTRVKLKDGTEFDGIDGLREYLLAKKKDVVVRLFCRRLLGYALGRAVTLSDQLLIDEMMEALNRSEGRISAAVMVIVRSPQFRMIRGAEFGAPE
ncbi:MAG: hypothetical protein JWO38_2011 [Gemmataceae bacterium]|nr:hypothetical protein [Gemmataceae bacterium]